MPDSVTITIRRNCDETGQTGTIADSATAVIPDGVLDSILAAYAAELGHHHVDSEPVSLERNMIWQIRRQTAEYLQRYLTNTGQAAVAAQVATQVAATQAAISVIDGGQ